MLVGGGLGIDDSIVSAANGRETGVLEPYKATEIAKTVKQ